MLDLQLDKVRVSVVYRGGQEQEIIICGACYSHVAGGWMCTGVKGMKNMFISSADIRSIIIEKEENKDGQETNRS